MLDRDQVEATTVEFRVLLILRAPPILHGSRADRKHRNWTLPYKVHRPHVGVARAAPITRNNKECEEDNVFCRQQSFYLSDYAG